MVNPRISRPTARIASSTSRTVRLACFCFCLARARLFRLPPCFRFWDLPPELRPLVFCFALRREALPEVPSFFLPAVLWPDFAARGAFSSGAADARRTLRSWIAKNTALQAALAQTGYSEKAILLTPAQVRLFFKFLGEP